MKKQRICQYEGASPPSAFCVHDLSRVDVCARAYTAYGSQRRWSIEPTGTIRLMIQAEIKTQDIFIKQFAKLKHEKLCQVILEAANLPMA
jgi:hypothetical protein